MSLPRTPYRGAAEKVAIVRRHHVLVRWAHWLNIPILLGLALSGLSIYWASPVYQHAPDPQTGSIDPLADAGLWLCTQAPAVQGCRDPQSWIYNHLSLGPGRLAIALRFHWLFVYLFMLNGVLYVAGLALGRGYRALLPRGSDLKGVWQMFRFYAGALIARLLRKRWRHPQFTTKYNALQRSAYFTVLAAGALSVLTGWAIHKPVQLSWAAALFGGYDAARAWHFWLLWVFVAFAIPHIILVLADGWDTMRSMLTGWSSRTPKEEHAAR